MVTLAYILISHFKNKKTKENSRDSLDNKGGKKKVVGLFKKKKVLGITLGADALISTTLAISMVFSSVGNLSGIAGIIAGNQIIFSKDEDEEDPDKDKDWEFNTPSDKGNGGAGGVSGGVRVKDRKIRFRAELMELIQESIDASVAAGNNKIYVAYILGTLSRETGSAIYTAFDNSNLESLYDDLIIENPVCRHGNCDWMNKSHSHYVGGSVQNKKDTGDPYTQILDFHMASYKKYNGPKRKDHAVGWVQMEVPYTYTSHFRYVYPNMTPQLNGLQTDTDYSVAQGMMLNDTDLGFIRPNIAYIPDVIFNGTVSNTWAISSRQTELYGVIEKSGLSEENQYFLKFCVRAWEYGVGNVDNYPKDQLEKMIKLVKDNKIEYLGNMLKTDTLSNYWSSSGVYPLNNREKAMKHFQNEYGIGVGYTEKSALWFGLVSACTGEIAVEQFNKVIDTAEKEGGNSNGGGALSGELGSPEYLKSILYRELNWYNNLPGDTASRKQAASKKYWDWGNGWAGSNNGYGASWCACFCAYVWHHSGILESNFGGYASSGSWRDYGMKGGNVTYHTRDEILNGTYTPSLGDIVVYYGRHNPPFGSQHVGVCVEASGTGSSMVLHTIEGNTSASVNGSQSQGGQLGEKTIASGSRTMAVTEEKAKKSEALYIHGVVTYNWSLGALNYDIYE